MRRQLFLAGFLVQLAAGPALAQRTTATTRTRDPRQMQLGFKILW
jgi:hypothetical protein